MARRTGSTSTSSELFYAGERNHVVEYLSGHGWQVSARTRPEVFAGYGREFPDTEAACRRCAIRWPSSQHESRRTSWPELTVTPGIWRPAWARPPPVWPHRARWHPNSPIRSSTTRSPSAGQGRRPRTTATEIADGELDFGDDPLFNRAADVRADRRAHAVFRRLLHRRGRGGNPAGGHPGLRASTPAPTGCRGRRTRWCSRSTSHRSSSSRSGTLAESGRRIPRPIAGRCRSIFATTGRQRCATADSIPPSPRPGSPRDC